MRIDLEVLSSSARDTGSKRDARKRQCESDRQRKNIIQLRACSCATLVAPMSLDRATGPLSGVVGRVIPLRSFCRVGEATAHSAGLYCAPHFSAATLFVQPSVVRDKELTQCQRKHTTNKRHCVIEERKMQQCKAASRERTSIRACRVGGAVLGVRICPGLE